MMRLDDLEQNVEEAECIIVKECLKLKPYFGNPNVVRLKYVLQKPSNRQPFKKLLLGMIRLYDLEQNFEEKECIKQ